MLAFMGSTVSVITIQVCCCNARAAMNTWINRHGCELHLEKQAIDLGLAHGHSWPTNGIVKNFQ